MRLDVTPITLSLTIALSAAPTVVSVQALAQAPATASAGQTAAPRQSGTVKAVTPTDFVLTSASGQDIAVTLPATVRVLLVDPTTRDVKTAQPGTIADIAGGDKVIVAGTAGDSGQTMTATRVYLLKSGAIAAMHEQEQAAWAHSIGGIVKSVDPATGTITVANGARSYTISTTQSTTVRRYSGASVRFEDAVKSTVGAIQPGDQVQARGQRTPDSPTMTADEIVTGSFSNFSGTLASIDPAGGTVTLKDLATKKTVTVALTEQTSIKKLPANYGQGMGARPGGGQGSPAAGGNTISAPATGSQAGAGAAGRPGAGRVDLSRIVNRLPSGTVADLKPGDAVLIVASNSADSAHPTAITLLSGVEQILAASPAGQTTLSPWSLGGGGEGEGGESSGGTGAR